jgi:hypothetical protein
MRDDHVSGYVNGHSLNEEDAAPLKGIINGVVLSIAFLLAVLAVVWIVGMVT